MYASIVGMNNGKQVGEKTIGQQLDSFLMHACYDYKKWSFSASSYFLKIAN